MLWDADGIIETAPSALFKILLNVSNESANNVITLIGIPIPGGIELGTGIALIILIAVVTVEIVASVTLTVD